ncbi:cytochrome c oxidase copper chaperone [Lates calcarifer]|uniref:Cytochrome c oxidase copper chaperone n=1 Tax=Lates calcarifer TaxID=8187 RepID=A0A4W6EZC0_LATCA|nr:cytochrome c oxidase copper chaperone [Lates calcarifer]XP_050922859.1 cytochrome c oxidase copper chaperone [Lates calcarifer]
MRLYKTRTRGLVLVRFEGETFASLPPCNLKMSTLSAASVESAPAPVTESTEQKKPLKPCCACPETKKVRDACIIEKGEENCTDLIEAHKDCMRALGFKI